LLPRLLIETGLDGGQLIEGVRNAGVDELRRGIQGIAGEVGVGVARVVGFFVKRETM
jgi:hypothetical protein